MADIKKVTHPSYVTITQGMRGFFAVLLTWNDDLGGFYEPYNTGIGSYKSSKDAEPEARSWAEAEELEFRLPSQGAPDAV